jgi:predicted metalloprotease
MWHGAAAMGPFYCPPDKTIFLDTGFFRQVETRFRGCSGNACKFTAAYIIAHEAGHHIQNLLGILPRVTRLQQQVGSRAEANALQVKVELQADCLSGVWVNREQKKRPNFLEAGDIDAALTRRPRSATTRCSGNPREGWCRIRSPTAPPRNENNGS